MEELNNKALTPEESKEELKNRREEIEKSREEMEARMHQQLDEIRKKSKESTEAISEGKGRLKLENPFKVHDQEIDELAYDFTVLTGMEYADAMDNDPNANQIFRITYRQGLALFAKAAAKQTDGVDQQEILEKIGMTDAVEGVQLATLFFSASTRAGRLRISKR